MRQGNPDFKTIDAGAWIESPCWIESPRVIVRSPLGVSSPANPEVLQIWKSCKSVHTLKIPNQNIPFILFIHENPTVPYPQFQLPLQPFTKTRLPCPMRASVQS